MLLMHVMLFAAMSRYLARRQNNNKLFSQDFIRDFS